MTRLLAGILLIVLPTVMIGRVSILSLLIGDAYMENPLRQDLWRAGHAHAGVWLIMALVALRYVDEANLSNVMKWLVRGSIPIAAIMVPAAFFLSVLSPDASSASASSGVRHNNERARFHSITSSARSRKDSGSLRPSTLAVQGFDEPAGLTPERLPTEVQAGWSRLNIPPPIRCPKAASRPVSLGPPSRLGRS